MKRRDPRACSLARSASGSTKTNCPDDERGFLAQQRTRVRGVLGRDEKGGTPRRRGLERVGACGVRVPPLVIPSTCHCLLRRYGVSCNLLNGRWRCAWIGSCTRGSSAP